MASRNAHCVASSTHAVEESSGWRSGPAESLPLCSGKDTMTTQLFRRAAVLTAAAITLSALSSPARAADPTPAELSAAWLTGELTDGLVHNDQYAFDDIGLTIDVGLALNAIGSQPAAVAQLRAAVAPEIKGYTTYKKSVFAASTAKALVLAQTLGASPRSFGGVNLVKQL